LDVNQILQKNLVPEWKQVGFRQEAARLSGIESCGRELCCSTWPDLECQYLCSTLPTTFFKPSKVSRTMRKIKVLFKL
jgi:hypothetical protein